MKPFSFKFCVTNIMRTIQYTFILYIYKQPRTDEWNNELLEIYFQLQQSDDDRNNLEKMYGALYGQQIKETEDFRCVVRCNKKMPVLSMKLCVSNPGSIF